MADTPFNSWNRQFAVFSSIWSRIGRIGHILQSQQTKEIRRLSISYAFMREKLLSHTLNLVKHTESLVSSDVSNPVKGKKASALTNRSGSFISLGSASQNRASRCWIDNIKSSASDWKKQRVDFRWNFEFAVIWKGKRGTRFNVFWF